MYLVLFLHSLSVYVIMVSSDAAKDYYERCIVERCFMMPKSLSLRKTKAQAEQWCSERSWTLASVNSQREQDDIDTFRFSLPSEAQPRDYFYIQSALQRTYKNYACWNSQYSTPRCDEAGIEYISSGHRYQHYIPHSYNIYAIIWRNEGKDVYSVVKWDTLRYFICQYPKLSPGGCPNEQFESEDGQFCFERRDSEYGWNWYAARKRCLDSKGDLAFFGINLRRTLSALWVWLKPKKGYWVGMRTISGLQAEDNIPDFQYTLIYGAFNATSCISLRPEPSTWTAEQCCNITNRFICQTTKGSVTTAAAGTVSSTSISTVSTAVVLDDIDTGNDKRMTADDSLVFTFSQVLTMMEVLVAVIAVIALIVAAVVVVYKKQRSRPGRNIYEGTTQRSPSTAAAVSVAWFDAPLYTTFDPTYEEPSSLITRPSEESEHTQAATTGSHTYMSAYEDVVAADTSSGTVKEGNQLAHEYENVLIGSRPVV